ncbi:MAG TPA: hypothetical protein VF727_08065 [Allosphingosinicella sp.]|jgi:uncharacterized membrane protein
MIPKLEPFAVLLAGCTLLLTACVQEERPYGPVNRFEYGAFGHNPDWTVTVRDDSLVLTLLGEGAGAPGSFSYTGVLANTRGKVTRWEATGGMPVTVQAGPGPCRSARGQRYEDVVTVSLSGRQLHGCGGRRLSGGRG